MAKRKPFDILNIIHQKRFKNQGFTMKENTGIDTETYKGYVKLICDDSGRSKDVENFDDILKFLTHYRFRNSFNWFYNIKFDFESIIKFLDYGTLINLYQDKKIEYGGYSLTYLDKKFFSIQDENNNYYYFYDLFNFLEVGLNKAAKKFLNDSKLDNLVDSAELNINLQYWNDNYDNIVKYCIKDSLLTKQLADYFWDIVYKNMQYYPKRPFSKGKIAEEYFLSKCYIPTINNIPNAVLKYAYNSYFGGRFEILKKGYFPQMYSYDIASAYPYQMTNLIDFSKGGWNEVKNIEKPSEGAYTGFYDCKISCNEAFFSPFIYKVQELNVFPNGKFKQFLTKQEIDFINLHFENADISIVKGYEFYPNTLEYPFKSEIERLYAWKEKEKDENIKYAVKIFMNSLYGKTIQVSGDYNRTGKLFNPIYASLITSGTRIKLYEFALQSPDDVIMFSTDSVHTTSPFKYPKIKTLGDFAQDFEGEGVYLMSDIYNLWNDGRKKYKSKLRGFTLAVEKDYQEEETDILKLKDILSQMQGTEYSYTTKRPYHLGECLLHRKARKIEDLNIFAEVQKTIKINGDKKRHWFSEFKSGKDCMKRSIASLPLKIGVDLK
jgi:hypothetical protein